MPTCTECGHVIPPEDPTDAQGDAFLDDDSTEACGLCSFLWIDLMLHVFKRTMEERAV